MPVEYRFIANRLSLALGNSKGMNCLVCASAGSQNLPLSMENVLMKLFFFSEIEILDDVQGKV